MVDVNGDEVGRMLYDGFGGVLTSTVPVTLTGTLPDIPDAATGLVHLGDGRYYDPALGRPLQPNPVGGPPTVPQALNRYTATPLGQPGVYEAANNSFNWTPSAISFSYGLTTQLAGYASKLVGHNYTANLLISATASRSALTRNWNKIDNKFITDAFGDAVFALKEGKRSFYVRSGSISLAGNSIDDLFKRSDEIVGSIRDALPTNKPWAARITNQLDDIAGQVTLSGCSILYYG